LFPNTVVVYSSIYGIKLSIDVRQDAYRQINITQYNITLNQPHCVYAVPVFFRERQ